MSPAGRSPVQSTLIVQGGAIFIRRELELSHEIDGARIEHSLSVMGHGPGFLVDSVGAEVRNVLKPNEPRRAGTAIRCVSGQLSSMSLIPLLI
jgi:hypothetical protein